MLDSLQAVLFITIVLYVWYSAIVSVDYSHHSCHKNISPCLLTADDLMLLLLTSLSNRRHLVSPITCVKLLVHVYQKRGLPISVCVYVDLFLFLV